MTIDQLIERLESVKIGHGGSTPVVFNVYTECDCQGKNEDHYDIYDVIYDTGTGEVVLD